MTCWTKGNTRGLFCRYEGKEGKLVSVSGMRVRPVYEPVLMGNKSIITRGKAPVTELSPAPARKFASRTRCYPPVRLGIKHVGQPLPDDNPRFSRRATSRRKGKIRPEVVRPAAGKLSGVKIFPIFAAAFILMILVGTGSLDDWILMAGPIDAGPFPGDVEPVVSVLMASVDMPSSAGKPVELVYTGHRVARGETLSRISYKYGLSPATLISINNLKKPDDVRSGVTLVIPYMDGVRVVPRPGESPEDIAVRFDTLPEMVQLLPGSGEYFVSGGSADSGTPSSFIKDVFLYPVSGRILTAFGEGVDTLTGISYESDGIDLSAIEGTPVIASREGTVILTGHHSSYGLYVIMSHSGGWKSFYGHLSRVDVAPGDELESGMALGAVGDSGTARSYRLHFALIHDGNTVDPLDYLF